MPVETKNLRALAPWGAAIVSAALLELPFPLAGPMPPWRSLFAWIGLVPLLWAVLGHSGAEPTRPLHRAFRLAYLSGILWYAGNCYWIYNTMHEHGDLPPAVALLILLGFSLVLGLYFGLFGLGLTLVRRATGRAEYALAAAPFLWTALDLAAARITSVPWDQLGYSQVDNPLITRLAPWTGVYGITFLLVAANALLAASLLPSVARRRACAAAGALLTLGGLAGLFLQPRQETATATAVLIQPNLNVGGFDNWSGSEWERRMAQFTRQARSSCTPYLAGIPQTGAPRIAPDCPAAQPAPDLVAWPESPAPFTQNDARFQSAMASVAQAAQAPLAIGGIGIDLAPKAGELRSYNSAMLFSAQGAPMGRYDKIHLVPYGEYVPFQQLFAFAGKLTSRVSEFARGSERSVFPLNGHRYGIFICYESVFAAEVRLFAKNGAEVFLNLSDDGWYGDTSAPWQHLNIARMRAIENRRWILRATNDGVTAAIDPYGRVRQSIPRNQIGALAAQYGFRSDVTFYTAHGDFFACLCGFAALGGLFACRLKGSQLRRQTAMHGLVGLWKNRKESEDTDASIRSLRHDSRHSRLKDE